MRESVQSAADRRTRPSSRPRKGKTLEELADTMAAGPSLALASSIFTTRRPSRMAFGVIGEDGKPVYGPTAIYVAPTPSDPPRALRRPRRRAADRRALPLQAGRDRPRTRSSPSTART